MRAAPQTAAGAVVLVLVRQGAAPLTESPHRELSVVLQNQPLPLGACALAPSPFSSASSLDPESRLVLNCGMAAPDTEHLVLWGQRFRRIAG